MINENNNYSIDHIKTTTNEKNYCLEIMQVFCGDTIITWKSVPTQKCHYLCSWCVLGILNYSNFQKMRLNLSELTC